MSGRAVASAAQNGARATVCRGGWVESDARLAGVGVEPAGLPGGVAAIGHVTGLAAESAVCIDAIGHCDLLARRIGPPDRRNGSR
jgi:hypothetical protein